MRSVKLAVKKTGKWLLTYDEELDALLYQYEFVINTHPLTRMGEHKLNDALTLFHEMLGRNVFQIRFIDFEDNDKFKFVKRYTHFLKSINDSRKPFSSVYLSNLHQHFICKN